MTKMEGLSRSGMNSELQTQKDLEGNDKSFVFTGKRVKPKFYPGAEKKSGLFRFEER